MKTLVVYYSLDGNTKAAAEKIANRLGTVTCELKTREALPQNKLKKMFLGGMQVTLGRCPKLEPISENLEEYDQIIIGTPVWAGKSVPAVNSLFKQYNICDKIIAVFTSSGGGDNEGCIRFLKKYLPSLKVNVSLADRNNESATLNDSKIEEFVEKITLMQK